MAKDKKDDGWKGGRVGHGKHRERHGDGPDREDETPAKGGPLPEGVEGHQVGGKPGRKSTNGK